MRVTALVAILTLAFASLATAAPATKGKPDTLAGSDTLYYVVQYAIAAINSDTNPDTVAFDYLAFGSSCGQRQLEGGATVAGEPTCTPNGSGTVNDGCQQIAPMARPMNNGICDDDSDNFGAATSGESDVAEGLAICEKRLTVTLAPSNTCGGDLGATWQSKLKLLYTGCTTETGAACSGVVRTTRCARPERLALISSFEQFVPGCAEGTCPGGLRAAYRPDDATAVASSFLGYLGLSDSQGITSARVSYRPRIGACGAGAAAAPSQQHPYCDGGSFEGFFNDPLTGAVGAGDPVRMSCAAEDDLCGRDGKTGVVRAIRRVPSDIAHDQAFPALQCTRGARALVTVDSTSCTICPDGTVPVGGKCWFPYYNDNGVPNFNCLSDRTNFGFSPNCSGSASASNYCDGRTPNFWTVSPSGVARFAATAMPEVAQYRQNMANLNTGFGGRQGGPVSSFVCTDHDSDVNIGCLVGNTTCTTGMADVTQLTAATNAGLNVGLALDGKKAHPPADPAYTGYPLRSVMWINAIGGFANLLEQCGNDTLNEAATMCEDQMEFANWFRNPVNAANACIGGGLLPLFEPGSDNPMVECVGSLPFSGCGSSGHESWNAADFPLATACLAN